MAAELLVLIVLPVLLAISADSPFLDGRDSGLHSARTQTFTRSFPRCGVPDAFGSWSAFSDYIEMLVRTRSIKRSRLARFPPRFISFRTFCEACCKGISRYFTAFGSSASTSRKPSLICVG